MDSLGRAAQYFFSKFFTVACEQGKNPVQASGVISAELNFVEKPREQLLRCAGAPADGEYLVAFHGTFGQAQIGELTRDGVFYFLQLIVRGDYIADKIVV